MSSFNVSSWKSQLAAQTNTYVDPKEDEQKAANKIGQANNSMGKDQFLNLLITQLRNQDPLNPMEDKDFIAQMAQFSSLEQMQQMNTGFQQTKASSLIGKYVTGTYYNETTAENEAVEGTVDYSKTKDGKVYVNVSGKDVLVDNIETVQNTSDQDKTNFDIRLSRAENMIGKSITGAIVSTDNDGNKTVKKITGKVVGVVNDKTNINVKLEDGTKVNLDDIIEVDQS